MKKTSVVLSIDVGTSSTRAGFFDSEGMPHGRPAQRANRLLTDSAGKAVLDASALVQGVIDAVDEVLAANVDAEVLGVGLSCFWHSLLGIDAAGDATTDVLTWADRRAGRFAAAQRLEGLGRPALHARTGCPVHSSYWTAKLPWLRDTEPGIWQATSRWVSAADYMFHLFFDKARTSVSMASGTGLFNIESMGWDQQALDATGVAASALLPVDDRPFVGLNSNFAGRWPRLDAVPWFPAVGDGACSNIGVGGIDRQTLVLMLGTSGSMRMVWDADKAHLDDPGSWCYRVDARRFAGGMALSEGGASAAWTRAQTGSTDNELEALIGPMAPDAHGLTVLPYVLGARSPDWDDGRSACIAGITAATSAAQIHRAMLESVGLSFAGLKSRLEKTMHKAKRVVVTGGALSRSGVWRQIVADCIGEDVEMSDVDEASLRGAALLALNRLGVGRLEDFAYRCSVRVRFDPDAHAAYALAGVRRQRLDGAIKQWEQAAL